RAGRRRLPVRGADPRRAARDLRGDGPRPDGRAAGALQPGARGLPERVARSAHPRGQRVMAPIEADETERAYFAITPFSYFGGRGSQAASRRTISSWGTS